MKYTFLLFISLFIFSCDRTKTDPPEDTKDELYFPPIGQDEWVTKSADSLGWDLTAYPELLDLLETNGTRAFILLKDGRIVFEEYFGKDILNITNFNKSSTWYWASAGKTLTSFTVGKAQEDGFLNIQNPTSDYLGKNWTSLTDDKESKITVWNQLSMTTGLDDLVVTNTLEPASLKYISDAGTRWSYHNAPYTLLDAVVESAVGEDFENYFDKVLQEPIGMNGAWRWLDDLHVFFSTARDMARYGLLMQNEGNWGESIIMADKEYLKAMTTPSQTINKSYGYLWWLNGKSSFMLPQSQFVFPGSIHPDGPVDMYSGIGKNGQYVSVVPSQGLVLVRMGENPDQVLVPTLFQNDIWKVLNKIIK